MCPTAKVRLSFAIETTLAGHRKLDLIRDAKLRGYRVNLLFVGLDSPERSILRIRSRVAKGGHFVPDADVRRRYVRSTANGGRALRLVDRSAFYDNSGESARLILTAEAGVLLWRADPFPEWVKLQ
jgi:predicted ABC-type ATPase